MRIHTDTITEADLHRTLPAGTHLECMKRGSRKRDHAFEVGMGAVPGSDANGIKRCYARNTGQYGGDRYDRAATWVEWGDWMVELFQIDSKAIIGNYDGIGDFLLATAHQAPHRQERESAANHAARWARTLAAE